MNATHQKQADLAFKKLTSRTYKKPSRCKSVPQIQQYIEMLTIQIDELKKRFNYVPERAYALLSEYNYNQNRLLYKDFKKCYKSLC